MKVTIKHWHAIANWRWDIGAAGGEPAGGGGGDEDEEEDVCGICRVPYEACCPACKTPGDDCPLSAFNTLPLRVQERC
jgi:anaphase-promoting complex subunit 11